MASLRGRRAEKLFLLKNTQRTRGEKFIKFQRIINVWFAVDVVI